MSTCPYCKEEIQWNATICPHCRSDLGNPYPHDLKYKKDGTPFNGFMDRLMHGTSFGGWVLIIVLLLIVAKCTF